MNQQHSFQVIPDRNEKLIVRSSSNVRGKPWFDCVVIEWPKEEFVGGEVPEPNDRLCFAKVEGFIRYDVHDYPTFGKRHGLVANDDKDSNLYVVCDAATSFITMEELALNLVQPFELEDSDRGLRIFPVECIKKGLAVTTDFKSRTSTHYLAAAPRKCWGALFSSRIAANRDQLLNDSPDVVDISDAELVDNDESSGLFSSINLDEETDDDMMGEEEEESDREQESEDECGTNDLVNCMLEQCKGSQAKKVL